MMRPGQSSEEVHRANIRDMQNIGVKIINAADLAAPVCTCD